MTAGQSSSCFSEPREELVFSLHMASGCSMATVPSLHFTCTHMSSCEPMCGNHSRVRASPEIFRVALWQPGNLQQFLRSVLPKIFKEPLIYLLQPCSLWESQGNTGTLVHKATTLNKCEKKKKMTISRMTLFGAVINISSKRPSSALYI